MSTRRKSRDINNIPSEYLAHRANPNTEKAQHAATILSDNWHLGKSSDNTAWSEMTELSLTDEDIESQQPGSTSSAREKRQLRTASANQPLSSHSYDQSSAHVGSPTCSKQGKEARRFQKHHTMICKYDPYGTTASAHKIELRVDNSPHTDGNCSAPRAMLAELPQPPSLIQNVHQIVKTSVRNSLESLVPQENTLRRFWGALKETLDELGNVWGGDDVDKEQQEVLGTGIDRTRSVSAPVTPTRHSPREIMTPQTRLLLGSVRSRPSHYDSLNHSPVANSRSSKRKRKSRLRYKSPTPTRREHGSDIDASYSTGDECNDTHSRLLNQLLFPDPSRFPQDDLYVFIYKQDSHTGSVDPGSENNKPNTNRRESTLPDVAEDPQARSRAPVANALESSAGRSGRQSVANLVTGECQHGIILSQQTCELCNGIESSSAQSSLAQNCSTPLISRGEVDSRTGLLMDGSQAMISNSADIPDDVQRVDRVPTPNNLRDDVGAIFFGHANGNKAVDRKGRPPEKPKFTERIKEALRPQHPDLLKYKPGPARRTDAEPLANSNFHMSDDGRVHRLVEHPPTRSSDPGHDAGRPLTKEVASEVPGVEGGVDEWLDQIEPHDDAPDDLSSTGPVPPAPASPPLGPTSSEAPAVEVTPQHKKARRRQRLSESCTVLSARIPPERDITDLLISPFHIFQQELADKTYETSDALSGDDLMSAFGVSYDIEGACHYKSPPDLASHQSPADGHSRPKSVTNEEDMMLAFGVSSFGIAAQHNVTGSISPADDAMCQSAATGSLSTLNHINTTTGARATEIRRTRHSSAHTGDTSWPELDDAKEMSFCLKPPVKISRNHYEYHATGVYDMYNMFPGTTSRTPLRTIRHWLSMHQWNHKMQQLSKHA
jgi:hypothetical protein